MKFTELNLQPNILKALQQKGWEDLTPIQEMTFPHVLSGRDMIARAETGSGKTAACAIPVVQNVDPSLDAIQALILVPTRELALQYVGEISDIAKHTGVIPFAVYGGFSIAIQKSKLEHGVHVLVATPGRLIDLLYNTDLSLGKVATFVLDEADEMLDMGFLPDVEFVLSCLVHEHQTLLFSATMPDTIKHLASRVLKDPVTVELNVDKVAPTNLEHRFRQVNPRQKSQELLDFFEREKPKQAIIFCKSRSGVDRLFHDIKGKIKSIDLIHGGQDQSKRTSLFRRFRKGDIKVIVATDVAGRGLDFSHVSHVINYDLPGNPEEYTHRTGRTARMGRKGVAMTFFTSRDLRAIKMIILKNHLKPVFEGEEPDLEKVSGRGGAAGHGRGRGRGRPGGGSGGGRKRSRRRKPKSS